jgi:undecaprenyl-diphosphatase
MLKARWKKLYEKHGAKWPFALALLTLFAALCVVELSEEVVEGDTAALDTWVFSLFHSADKLVPRGPEWLREVMIDITALGSHTLLTLAALLAGLYALAIRRGDRFLMIAATSLGALFWSSGLKKLIGRERPSSIEPLVDVSSYSYPSGHALVTMAIYLSFALIAAEEAPHPLARAFIIVSGLMIAVFTGVSRIYLGVHYFTDVVAGWTIGGCWAVTCWLATRYLSARARDERPAPP